MADPADRAQQETEAYEEAQRLKRLEKPYQIPAGKPGECNECGEDSPCLVDGMCARCRDKLINYFERTGRR